MLFFFRHDISRYIVYVTAKALEFDKRTGTLTSKSMRLCKIFAEAYTKMSTVSNRYIRFTRRDVRLYQVVKVSISLLANI